MKPSRTIKYKAVFLLVTFSLNSVVGFACSLGVDMGFNAGHHEHNDQEQHKHAQKGHTEGHRNDHHDHHGKKTHKHSHNHSDNNNHKHHQHEAGNTVSFNEPADDNCCNDLVVDFQNLDKAVVKGNSNVQQQQIELSPFVVPAIPGLNNIKGFTKHFRFPPKETDLPPPDIIVFIQSFLI